jgi:eukaryotic-like serine/threonine-protein kinase
MASSSDSLLVIRFDEFELKPANGELRKRGQLLKFHPQPFRLLLLLAEHPGQIVTRQEIRRCLWADNTFVDFEHGINFCVRQIRAALADDAENPRYIETLPRRGYRFIAPVNHGALREQVISFQTAQDCKNPFMLSVKHSSESVSAKEIQALPSLPALAHRVAWNSKLVRASISTVFCAALLIAGTVFYFRRPPKLTEKDTVVLADFNNTAGDPVFDGALKQALTVGLNQSPFLNLLPDKKITETLRLMGRSPFDRITPDVAREICLRTGSKAYLSGTISALGSAYLLDVNAIACASGNLLASAQEQAHRKEDVLKVLSRTAAELRSELGESLPSVEKYDVPIEATTTSLKALQSMSTAARVGAAESDAASIPFVQRALEYDPNFASAYAALARRYQNLDQPQLALENAAKAYRLRDQVSEREQFEISSIYFRATGDLDNLTKTVELWKVIYPRDSGPHARLCVNYQFLGHYDKALAECQEALRLDPAHIVNYVNFATIYMNLNRYDDAQHICELALARQLPCSWIYFLDFVRGDTAGMAKELSSAIGRPGEEDAFLSAQSDTHFYYGRLRLAREFSHRAADSALRSGYRETASLWQAKSALCEAELGENAAAKRGITNALQLSSGRITKVLAAIVFARVGDTARAEELLKQLQQSNPANTLLKIYWFPVINTALQLKQGNLSEAFLFLQAAAPYDFALPSPNEIGTLYPVYLRGQACLAAHNGPGAAAEFQKVLDHQGITLNYLNGALARLGLARAYALQAQSAQGTNAEAARAKAHAAYQEFLTLWKDADPDIPILKEAKAEYAKLQ